MKHTVKVHSTKGTNVFIVEDGKNLLEFLKENSFDVSTPCGGKGTCGKCRVKVKGYIKEPSENEKRLLNIFNGDNEYRLACYNKIEADIELFVEDSNKEVSIITSGIEKNIEINPLIEKKSMIIEVPSIDNQKSDVDRIIDALNPNSVFDSIEAIKELPDTIRKDNIVTAILYNNQILGIEQGNTQDKLYGIAVDIGTTTLAAYLYNLRSGQKLDVYSALNPQGKHGADVLTRIEYTNNSLSNQIEMHNLIIDCLNNVIKTFEEKNRIDKQDIYSIVFAGNTTMMHFLMNLPAKYMALSPFIPVTTKMYNIKPSQLGININKNGLAICLPCVSAYIGADTIAAVVSSDINKSEDICLLVDIGTNGEMVLGNKEWMYSCSTAAGPAFEGANIQYGVGGIKGAIDKINFNEKLEYHTIGSEKAVGICGSGIVDAVSGMLDKGIIDETGRIIEKSDCTSGEYNFEKDYQNRLVKINGMNSFIIAEKKETGIDSDIVITQKDIRELQNAKAAIAAGIKILIKQANIKGKDIKNIYLAGGFGNYIDTNSAFKIGLLPSDLDKDNVVSIGNAAGAGAIEGLLSKDCLDDMKIIKDKIKYIELSSILDFVEEYVDCMFFE